MSRVIFSIPPENQLTAMKTFVILFRQDPRRPLTDTDKQRRGEETAAWAARQNAFGHKLEPRILAPESVYCAPENSAATQLDGWPITALLFLEARDLDEAAHPAVGFGASVEVRPWAPPIPAAPATRKTP